MKNITMWKVLQIFFLTITVGGIIGTETGCKRDEKFPDLGGSLAGPVDIKSSDSGDHFYVLNADFDRTYNIGSILVLDEAGTKVSSVEVPRMGRSLTIAGTDMITTHDFADDETDATVILWSLEDETNPVKEATFKPNCTPVNAVMVKGYKHFAVTCIGGTLFIGTLTDDRAQSTIKKVRSYSSQRRALYIDAERELLFGFPTRFGKQDTQDGLFEDTKSYEEGIEIRDPDGEDEEGRPKFKSKPNEVPDSFENSKRAASQTSRRRFYQFYVYDLAKERDNPEECEVTEEEDCVFPNRSLNSAVAKQEFRWFYFHAKNFDGSPDLPESTTTVKKYYRTNFWAAAADPDDPNVFYLSHRGPPLEEINSGSPYANHVVKVTVVGDPRPDGETVPKTSDFLKVERIYGFRGENKEYHYPGDLAVGYISGQKVLVVNHFRDLDNWKRTDVYFSVAVKVLDDQQTWFAETPNNFDPLESYYQVALSPRGKIMSNSFYGNKVMVLDVTPGVGISVSRTK